MKLFISYAHVDRYRVEELVQILRDAGHDPWFDHKLLPGQDRQQEQTNAIDACNLFIHVITEHSNDSDSVQQEFEQAVKQDKLIMSVLLDENIEIPTWLNPYPHTDFSMTPTASTVAQLLGSIHSTSMGDDETDMQATKRKGQSVGRSKILSIAMIATVLLFVVGVFVFNTLSSEAKKQAVIDLSDQGLEALESREYEVAIQFYTDALELDPNYVDAYINRGRAYFTLGRYETAMTNYEQVLELSPNYAPAYFYRANAYYGLGEFEIALTDYNKAIDLDPNYAKAYLSRGFLYGELDEHEKAIADYDKAIALDINDALVYFNRGHEYWNQENYEKAIANYDKAIEVDSTYTSAYHGLGNVYYKLEQFDLALENYETYLELAGDSANEAIIKRVKELRKN